MASCGKIVLNYGDTLVRESEMAILMDNKKWLNDVIIGFYMEHLGREQDEGDGRVVLYNPGLSQILKISNMDSREITILLGDPPAETIQYAFWAVNNSKETETGASGSHWSLLIFSRPDDKFIHIDSFHNNNEEDARAIFKNVSHSFSPSCTFEAPECYSQENGTDCGLHVIANTNLILTFIKSKRNKAPLILNNINQLKMETATPANASQMRSYLKDLIVSLLSEPVANGEGKN